MLPRPRKVFTSRLVGAAGEIQGGVPVGARLAGTERVVDVSPEWEAAWRDAIKDPSLGRLSPSERLDFNNPVNLPFRRTIKVYEADVKYMNVAVSVTGTGRLQLENITPLFDLPGQEPPLPLQ